jgi:glycosyltransferase involved in cell wall biosynthesis
MESHGDLLKAVYWVKCRTTEDRMWPPTVTKFLAGLYCDLGSHGFDVLHLFNRVAAWSGPWVVSFSCELPRWRSVSSPRDGINRLGLRMLADGSCKRVIAISRNAFNVQKYRMARDPGLAERIEPKMLVLHPPQAVSIDQWEEKGLRLDGKIRFLIVGHLFFMKGGRSILQVFDRLLKRGAPVELTIISRLWTDEWASGSGEADVRWAKGLIAEHAGAIQYHAELSNQDVIREMKRTHVVLLPSHAETYGYSILEAQSCGCPVISSNVGAMPEINDSSCGWMINLPLQNYDGVTLGQAVLDTSEARRQVGEMIEMELERAILGILENPAQIPAKGGAALARVRRMHSPVEHGEALVRIYEGAMGSKT